MDDSGSYDYVVVGAGSAGCVMAARLSEDPGARVLLLEAGGWDRDPWIHIPVGWGKILQGRLHDWMYFCEPEASVGGRAVECARGKVVGGSSSTNAMAYVRGDRRDYDRWAAQGLDQWSADHVWPYFRKQETWEGGDTAERGGDGPLSTQFCKYQDPLLQAFRDAGAQAGHGWTDDYNGVGQEGFGRLQMTIGRGRRSSAATAYLRPALGRANLTVVTRALATRIVFDRSRAVGVEYATGKTLKAVGATREVILCGGVINTPQLLMLSGIGAPSELAAHGIQTRHSLPGVGKNLQDHVSSILIYSRAEPSPFLKLMRADRIAQALTRAYLFGSGPASDVPGGMMALLNSGLGSEVPDVQFLLTTASLGAHPYMKPFVKPFPDTFACRVVMLHPESRGQVSLRSADPAAHASIRQNFLGTDKDWAVLRRGLEMAREVIGQDAMKRYVGAELTPGPAVQDRKGLDTFIRNSAITVHHPAGTCRMGNGGDEGAVVDQTLKVNGLDGLRVVDASVMPDLPSGNINAAVIMIAEKAADLIRGKSASSRQTQPAPSLGAILSSYEARHTGMGA